jgi:AmmeMemoRadiSam system protein A
MTRSDRQRLLEIARQAVVDVVGMAAGARDPDPREAPAPSGELAAPGAAFVTLFVAGELRGCIGTSERARALHRVVVDMARAAATRDWRFAALSPADLASLDIEISVLGPERRIRAAEAIEIGRHGIDLRLGQARGVLLPQVAIEHGFDGEGFLAETCRKAELPADAWRDPEADIRVFEADVFSEAEAAD